MRGSRRLHRGKDDGAHKIFRLMSDRHTMLSSNSCRVKDDNFFMYCTSQITWKIRGRLAYSCIHGLVLAKFNRIMMLTRMEIILGLQGMPSPYDSSSLSEAKLECGRVQAVLDMVNWAFR
jgi:hypothetical protein